MGARLGRVLFVTGEYPPRVGGVGDHVVRLRAALEALGVQTHVATESPFTDRPAERVCGVSGRPWGRQLVELARLTSRIGPDVVHIQYQSGAFACPSQIALLPTALRLLRLRARIVATFHDLGEPYLFPKAGPLRRIAVDAIRRAADTSIYVDALDRGTVCARMPGHWRRSRVVPVGPTIEPPPGLADRDSLRAEMGLGKGEFLVGFLGFRQEGKGLATLASALRSKELEARHARLVLIGAGGPEVGPRRAAAGVADATLADLDAVDTGFLDPAAVSMWLRACDVIALPYDDGLSTRRGTFMVAAAHACPVVTTSPPRPDLPDVKAGEVALVPPADANALAAALARVRDEPSYRDELIRGSRAVAHRYSWPRIARQTLEAYGR